MRIFFAVIVILVIPVEAQNLRSSLPLDRVSDQTWRRIDQAHTFNRDSSNDLAELLQNFIYCAADRNVTEERLTRIASLANTQGQNFGVVRTDGTKQFTAVIELAECQQMIMLKTMSEQLRSATEQIRQLQEQANDICSMWDEKIRPPACKR
jgi:hypothetical protein